MDKKINPPNINTPVTENDIIAPMRNSRIYRIEEKRARKQLVWVIIGIISIFLIVIFLGIPMLIKFSVVVGNLKSNGQNQIQTDKTAPFPPTLSPIVSATNSASIKIEGYGEPDTTIKLFINDKEVKKALLGKDGSFSYNDLTLQTGENNIYALSIDSSNNESTSSEILKIIYKKDAPKLDILEPSDGQSFDKNHQEITVKGSTDAGNNVYINDRWAVMKDDGSFTFSLKLNDGENTLIILAKDPAGNETKIERKVTFNP